MARLSTMSELTLADIDAVRLLLRGDSVIDWHRLNYADHAEVDRFLRLNEFDPESDEEMARLEDTRGDAVEYLTRAFAMAIPDEVIFREIELKVMQVVEQLRAAGAPLTEWEWSRKPRDSQITKLLAKRSTLAANIYDKLRFRLIVPSLADIVPMLATLTRQLIPFNYVVPGESVNQLIDL